MAWRNIGNDPFDEDATSSSSADSHERDQEEPEARGNVLGAIGDQRNVVEVVEQPVLDLVAAMNGAGMNGPGAGAGAGGNPGGPGGLEGLMAEMVRVLGVLTINQQSILQMMNQQHTFNAEQAAEAREFRGRQRPLKLDANTFPPYEDTGTEAEKMTAFIAWETGVRHTLNACEAEQRMALGQIASAILASFRGKALEKATTINLADYLTLNEFMDGLRTLFCGAAQREVAYNLFFDGNQGETEDINTFSSRLQGLWLQAFDEANRSVQTLIRQFIQGLRSHKLQDKILTREGGPPNNYQEVRELAVSMQGQLDTMDSIRRDRKAKNPNPKKQPFNAGGGNRGGGTPMDVNNVAGGRGKKNSGGVHNVNAQGKNAGTSGGNGNQGGQRQQYDKNKCLNCGGRGHWKDACPSPKKGTGRPGSSVNNVEADESDPEDEDDAEDFVGCAELSNDKAGNAKGQA